MTQAEIRVLSFHQSNTRLIVPDGSGDKRNGAILTARVAFTAPAGMQGKEDDMKLELTKAEREILNHRLEVPDAICDALDQYHSDDVCLIAEHLLKGKIGEAMDYSRKITHAVLHDAIDGSTWYAQSYDQYENGEISQHQLAGVWRTCQRLAQKVSDFIGREVQFPKH